MICLLAIMGVSTIGLLWVESVAGSSAQAEQLVTVENPIRLEPDLGAPHVEGTRLGLTPARTAYVGDEVRDVDAARTAQVVSATVAWGYAAPEALRRGARGVSGLAAGMPSVGPS